VRERERGEEVRGEKGRGERESARESGILEGQLCYAISHIYALAVQERGKKLFSLIVPCN
jgi:hypothetical protein